MYEQYWRLERPAFENDQNPELFFPARSHHGALLKLRYLVEHHKGLGLLIGEHGLGKTFLTHVLERQLGAEAGPVVRLVFPQLSPVELLRYLVQRFGLMSGSAGTAGTDQLLARLEAHLGDLADAGRRPTVVIDDAHLLEAGTLQTLQLLLNLQAEKGGLTLLLVGRSDLLPRVKRLPALADRVNVKTRLQPLTLEEAEQYIRHRQEAAGRTESVLQPAAVRAVWELSQGVPRRLNQLCDLALLVGYADGLSQLSRVEVEAAADELCSISAD